MISDLRGICLNLERDLPEESELCGAQFPRDRHTGNILSCTSRRGRRGGGGRRGRVVVGQEAQQVKTWFKNRLASYFLLIVASDVFYSLALTHFFGKFR